LQLKITIAGTGYVGLSNAILLVQHNEVIALDIIQEKIDMINNRRSPIIEKNYFSTRTVEAVIANVLYINTDAVMVIN
jgi:UDPglucose 6-dehydrogenase